MNAELLEVMGTDRTVVDTARVSYNKEAAAYSNEQNTRLLNYLASKGHWSPFSAPQLRFRLTMPIYVERQLVKTQSGVAYNSLSGRYVDFSDSYYEIPQFRWQSTDSKQGSGEDMSPAANAVAMDIQSKVIATCKQAYEALVAGGISKEQARSVLPLSLQTTMIWTGSLYAFIRLCKQRLKPDAQQETRDLVQLMLSQVKEDGSFAESLTAYNL